MTKARSLSAFGTGSIIGTLGGLIGLGGAEFRLPLLIRVFRFVAIEAVIINNATSLVVVASALPFRLGTVPIDAVDFHVEIKNFAGDTITSETHTVRPKSHLVRLLTSNLLCPPVRQTVDYLVDQIDHQRW